MHDLIERLSSEHVELEQAFAGLRPRLFRTEDGPRQLARVRDLFNAHVAEESQHLYPAIRSAAAEDPNITNRIRRLDDDLHIVTELADGFFRKYETGIDQLVDFATDHGALLTILRIRLRREEETVFPLYRTLSRN